MLQYSERGEYAADSTYKGENSDDRTSSPYRQMPTRLNSVSLSKAMFEPGCCGMDVAAYLHK